ncbi:indolepyruvate ferredoxin oxidoreductase subunit alpha [Geobacter hydrogenophilus]|uniref:Indolepyruvate oxidoreductase subunit IorA n=1 Tax=Geobacter hydrogenophilus TaxID=40983 RepID=A0A9W6LCQ0_9BACT|nr:indolepyruvate ferredoxin oxidoreductase subunit alpha [Geobacter hydrogenophilus]MBT0893130.1 indolepyruvate ferredoxin oxidoreductase subunit alpha [Geobacter hydrogenophilus]GLI39028.1 indolepyruvate oxidoreductase subunit IorA [Geobacter hydrogenophilus]
MKEILSGNEAIARGAFEAGVKVASAYPGTPSTEILETIVNYKEIDASWAPNEKVAVEVAIGASFGGGRAIACMKHVGVNVAADPLFTLSYTGVGGGFVLVVADDPEMHSSQDEQDSRNYAKFAKVPMLEPADSQECKDFTRIAFELSEQFDAPVMLRSCTRISHGKSIVELAEPVTGLPTPKLVKNPSKLVMLPGNAKIRHPFVEERLVKLAEYGASATLNRVEMRDTEIGIITAGVSYQYVREVLPTASVLKLGMVHPLPMALIKEFAAKVKKLYVVEELDPFIEEQVKAAGIAVIGKEIISRCGELTPGRLRKAFGLPDASQTTVEKLPGRPPNMCPGCPHRGVFYSLSQLKAYVTGDIGCYTLGFMPPLNAMDTCVCMGASISSASGIVRVLSPEEKKKVVAVIGDSTFLHTGINSLMEMAYNQSPATVVILDNRITAMTGRQDNPASGWTLSGGETNAVDLVQLCKAVGIRHVRVVDPLNLEETRAALNEEMERPEPSVIITNRPCVLVKREGVFNKGLLLSVDQDHCTGCKACLKIGCPAIEWQPAPDGKKGKAYIDPLLCNGCDVCRQLCKFNAIGSAK